MFPKKPLEGYCTSVLWLLLVFVNVPMGEYASVSDHSHSLMGRGSILVYRACLHEPAGIWTMVSRDGRRR